MQIRKLEAADSIPWDLLLSADPAKPLVEEYIKKGIVYIGVVDEKIMGIYVLQKITDEKYELKNIAVHCDYQGKGYGKQLVHHAIEIAKENGAKKIEVGTGNSSLSQLALYQKCGFHMERIEKDFFIKNYKEKIFENGIQCRDMIILSMDL